MMRAVDVAQTVVECEEWLSLGMGHLRSDLDTTNDQSAHSIRCSSVLEWLAGWVGQKP